MTRPFIIDTGPSERGWSFYSTALQCPQLFFWKYVHTGAVTGSPGTVSFFDHTEATARGTIFHVGLAHLYARRWARENGKDPNVVIPPIDAMAECAQRIGEVGIERLTTAVSMFQAYTERFPEETFRVLAVEQPEEIIVNGYRVTARVDLEVVEPSGRVYFYDHKTAARMESKILHRYTLSGQMFGLAAMGRQRYGDRFGGVVINYATEDLNFLRKQPELAPWMERKYPLTITFAGDMIEMLMETAKSNPDAWPAFPSDHSCVGTYGPCPARELCRWGPPR